MKELNWPLGIISGAILFIALFALIAPTPTLAKVINAIGNTIQKVVAWIRSLFS